MFLTLRFYGNPTDLRPISLKYFKGHINRIQYKLHLDLASCILKDKSYVAYGQHQKLFIKTAHLEKENKKALVYHVLHTATKGTLVANFTQNIKVD